jgi:SAM-dependent methyltransferase
LQPTRSDLKQFYESWAAQREASPLEQDYVRLAAEWKWSHLERLIHEHGGPPQSLLEFGCGSGDLLELAGKALADASAGADEVALSGIDLSEGMIGMARGRLPGAKLVVGGLEALESIAPPVDLTLAVDILEHLEDPVRAARALGTAGERVALKIPIERRIIRLGLRQQGAGPEHHIAGHLHFWTLAESRRLLLRAGLEILGESCVDPPESIRYHEANVAPPTATGGALARLRSAHRAMETCLERWTCDEHPTLHRWMFGSTHFVVARRREPR